MLTLPAGHAHVWYAWTEQCAAERSLYSYRSLLNEGELARLGRFVSDDLKREYLVTRALCRLTLSRYAPVAPEDWAFIANRYGRPEIDPATGPTWLRFNLSNTRTLVACVVTSGTDAGVDAEDTMRAGDLLPLADRFFSADEVALLHATPAAQQRMLFFKLWSLKEAYIKACGVGLSMPLDQFSLTPQADTASIRFGAGLEDSAAAWQFGLYTFNERHVLAVAIRKGPGPDFPITLRQGLPL